MYSFLRKDNSCPFFFSVFWWTTSSLLKEQHPKSSNENPEDERSYRGLLHSVLDSILPTGPLVLVLPWRPGGKGLALPHPHPVYIWAFQHLPRPHHLRPLHRTLQQETKERLQQGHHNLWSGRQPGESGFSEMYFSWRIYKGWQGQQLWTEWAKIHWQRPLNAFSHWSEGHVSFLHTEQYVKRNKSKQPNKKCSFFSTH